MCGCSQRPVNLRSPSLPPKVHTFPEDRWRITDLVKKIKSSAIRADYLNRARK